MRKRHKTNLIAGAIATLFLALVPTQEVHAQQTGSVGQEARGPSGLPLPRFVSIKARRVNMRVGPGRDYAVDWLYLREGLPLEVIQEYDNWRRVRDADGAEGWIYQSLLSGKRTAIAAPWNKGKSHLIELRAKPGELASIVAKVEPGAVGSIASCDGEWCDLTFGSTRGWMKQTLLWGAYPGENIKN